MRGSTTRTVMSTEKMVRNTTDTAEKIQFMAGVSTMLGSTSWAAASV